MKVAPILLACVIVLNVTTRVLSAPPDDGLIARWTFEEAGGDFIRDVTGNGHDGKIGGGTRVKQAEGPAYSLDGVGAFVDFSESPPLNVTGPVSVELWLKPTREAHGEATLLGEGFDNSPMPTTSILMTYYNGENVYWYIGNGGNGIRGQVKFNQWNHVAATFDGKHMCLWINGRMVADRDSKFTKTSPRNTQFRLGTKGDASAEKFQGLMADVRVYNRALSAEEIASQYQANMNRYCDLTWTKRIKATLYQYPARGEILLEADYNALEPALSGKTKLDVTVSSKAKPEEVLVTRTLQPVPAREGIANVTVPCSDLPAGEYLVRAKLTDDRGALPVEELGFTSPMALRPLASPAQTVAPPLPRLAPTDFKFTMGEGGGFSVKVKETSYAFQTRVSWPKGDFNRLTPGQPYTKGEKGWKITTRSIDSNHFEADASGASYTIHREVGVFPTHVFVKDTYTNATDQDLGLLIYNETPIAAGQVKLSRLSGYDRRGRQAELSFPHYSLSSYFADANAGMGIVPMDDVYVVQAVPYVDWQGAAGVGTEKFALGAKKSYTVQWAIYPTGSGDYYDFINTFRKVENRIGTVDGAPGYTSYSLRSRRQVPDDKFISDRNLKIGIIPCLYYPEDDPDKNMEGIEFIDAPKERALLLLQNTAIKKRHPGFKMVFHIAHSLFATNNPDRFSDSKVIGHDGKQNTWGGGEYFGKYGDQGWRYWIFYPSPGNSFHDAMMKSVDVMMDEMGFDGAQLDGFFAGYGGIWTYDRWDEHSAEIDTNTKTISRKLGSVLLLSQPSMLQYARKIRDKGGVIIGMHTVFTPSMANEKYIIFSDEDTGPGMHLAPNMLPLARPGSKNEKELYLDMLEKLSWGEMFTYYSEPTFFTGLTHPTLASKQFPITFEEIRSGMVKGKERIVTMNSGVCGWDGDRRLHAIYKFDGRGMPVPNDFTTTVDASSVRTQLEFATHESAVIEPTAAVLTTSTPVNVRVVSDDDSAFKVLLNGQGEAALSLFVGSRSSPTSYRVKIGEKDSSIEEKNGSITVPLQLSGLTEVVIDGTIQGK